VSALKLPDLRREKVVLFHLVFADASEVVLQVPPREAGQPSNTFSFDLSDPQDSGWFQGLPNYRTLQDKLMLYGHAAYYPRTGTVQPLEDKELKEPTVVQQAIEGAEAQKDRGLLGKWAGVKKGVRRTRLGPFGKG